MKQDTTTHDHILQHAENFLNFEIREPRHQVETETFRESLKDVYITVPADRNREETFYHLRICEICGHTQAMNFEAYRKNNPSEAKQFLKEMRQEKAKKYVETGERPPSDQRLKKKIETANLNWNNSFCEQRHPPRE